MAINPWARVDSDGRSIAEFDYNSDETLVRIATTVLDEDFLGPGHSSIPNQASPATGYPWVQRVVKTSGNPTVAILANSNGGIVQNALDATSEKQEASLYANDTLNWDMTHGMMWECRANVQVLPTLLTEMVFGLQSAWVDGPDNAAQYCRFQLSGANGGLVQCQVKDGVQSAQSLSSGTVLTAASFHIFRVDATDPTNVRFFIDGTQVNAARSLTWSGSALMQPYMSCYKASGAGLGTLQFDSFQVSMNRSA